MPRRLASAPASRNTSTVEWDALTSATTHRPFPLPSRPWTMTMSWEKLLFAHWRVDVAALRRLVPAGLELDLFDGEAWVGVVPFDMRNVGLPRMNGLPWLSHFAEVNVRTYVTCEGMPGVFFFSLDAANWAAVIGARAGFHLPYFWASISWRQDGLRIHYRSRRLAGPPAELSGSYAPVDEVRPAQPGTLEHFLAERYCLYAADRAGTIYRGHVHHLPWPLQRAEATLDTNTLLSWTGLEPKDDRPLLHYADRIDVVGWTKDRVARAITASP